jgi:hypothetical protein
MAWGHSWVILHPVLVTYNKKCNVKFFDLWSCMISELRGSWWLVCGMLLYNLICGVSAASVERTTRGASLVGQGRTLETVVPHTTMSSHHQLPVLHTDQCCMILCWFSPIVCWGRDPSFFFCLLYTMMRVKLPWLTFLYACWVVQMYWCI